MIVRFRVGGLLQILEQKENKEAHDNGRTLFYLFLPI
jgi:hypothetical protein